MLMSMPRIPDNYLFFEIELKVPILYFRYDSVISN